MKKMGYQQSFVKFKTINQLKKELVKYKDRDKSRDQAEITGYVEVIKEIYPFSKGEVALIVSGERYEQRNAPNLKEGLGISNIDEIVFIDNPEYVYMAEEQNVELGQLLDKHFSMLDEESYTKHGLINPFN